MTSLTIYRKHVLSDVEEKVIVKYDLDTILYELIDGDHYPNCDFSSYYNFSRPFMIGGSGILPYIMIDGKFVFDVEITKVKVVDFLFTHHIKDDAIEFEYGAPMAGGPGFQNLIELWNYVEPVLSALAIAGTLSGISFKDIVHLFEKRKVKPQGLNDAIYSRSLWNVIDLANALNIDEEYAEYYLVTLGYEYDSKEKAYRYGEQAKINQEKLSKISPLDIHANK